MKFQSKVGILHMHKKKKKIHFNVENIRYMWYVVNNTNDYCQHNQHTALTKDLLRLKGLHCYGNDQKVLLSGEKDSRAHSNFI